VSVPRRPANKPAKADKASAREKTVSPRPDTLAPPLSAFAAYTGTPTIKKLGISEGTVVATVGAPHGFVQTLGRLPDGASVTVVGYADLDGRHKLCIWFPRSLAELRTHIGGMKDSVKTLCISWPKKASGVQSDLTQITVRKAGLAADWVDYKILSIDSIRSALLFARRKPAGRAKPIDRG
jgi:hypothetical protein